MKSVVSIIGNERAAIVPGRANQNCVQAGVDIIFIFSSARECRKAVESYRCEKTWQEERNVKDAEKFHRQKQRMQTRENGRRKAGAGASRASRAADHCVAGV